VTRDEAHVATLDVSPPAGSREGRPHTKGHNVEGPLIPLSRATKSPLQDTPERAAIT